MPAPARPQTNRSQLEVFVEQECIPADTVYEQQVSAHGGDAKARFSTHPQVIEDLKARAQALGLWNLFLPRSHGGEGAGFSNLEYGLMAELLGKSAHAPEVSELWDPLGQLPCHPPFPLPPELRVRASDCGD